MKVGYIGLGDIGGAMAQQLTGPPFELTVFDLSSRAMEKFSGKARLAHSCAEVGSNADVIGICVLDGEQVRTVLSGPDGLLGEIRKDAIILVHSTVSPVAIREFAALAATRGAVLMDAAVTGGAMAAANRKICAMVGGEEAALERAGPFLRAFSSNVVHAGPVGAGAALKICNNLIFYIQILATNEGYRLAEALGLAPDLLSDVMTANGNLTPMMRYYVNNREHGMERLGVAEYHRYVSAMGGLAEKDLDLALDAARTLGLPLPAAENARECIMQAFKT